MDLLRGTRIISLNHHLMGPLGAQYLADLGADVIAVEPMEGAFQRKFAIGNQFVDGQSVNFLAAGRNKRSIALNLKSEKGLAIARRLIEKADVLMENFRPGTMERLGLGYEEVKALNSRIIYASATGYGSTGPYRDRPGQDLLLQALCGLAAVTGDGDGPPTPVGPAVVDHHGGALYALGILAALVSRMHTGRGCLVEASLMSAALDLQSEALTCYFNGGGGPSPRGPKNIVAWFSPAPYGMYATRDGHIALSLGSLKDYAEALDAPELGDIPQDDAFTRREEIAEIVRDIVAQQTTEHWIERLGRHGIWHAPVQEYDAVRNDPQVRHNDPFMTLPSATGVPITLVAHPVRYDGELPPVRQPPQPLGAQTREILAELGCREPEIERLEAEGAVGSHLPRAAE